MFFSSDNLSKLLPFGYLYLIVMGILKDSVYYYFFGIHFLNYSTVMDVLLSPISDITSEPPIFFAVVGFVVFSLFLYFNRTKKWAKKYIKIQADVVENREQYDRQFKLSIIKMNLLWILFFFLGIGFGRGFGESQKMKNEKFRYATTLYFISDAEPHQVQLIKANTANYFYVEKGAKVMSISPVTAIKSIRKE